MQATLNPGARQEKDLSRLNTPRLSGESEILKFERDFPRLPSSRETVQSCVCRVCEILLRELVLNQRETAKRIFFSHVRKPNEKEKHGCHKRG